MNLQIHQAAARRVLLMMMIHPANATLPASLQGRSPAAQFQYRFDQQLAAQNLAFLAHAQNPATQQPQQWQWWTWWSLNSGNSRASVARARRVLGHCMHR